MLAMRATIAEALDTYPADVRPFMEFFLVERGWVGSQAGTEGWRYRSHHDLLLELGRLRRQDFYVPDDEVFAVASQPQECFGNAYAAVVLRPDRYTYVEGKAATDGLVVNHAWLEDADGTIIDPTWGNHLETDATPTYYGIRFAADFVLRRALDTGWVSILNREWDYRPDFPALRFGFVTNDEGLVIDYGEQT